MGTGLTGHEEHRVEAALLHLGQVDLGLQPVRVVGALRGEVVRVDVDVGVDGDGALVDGPRPGNQRGLIALRRLRCGGAGVDDVGQPERAQPPLPGRRQHPQEAAVTS